jgi:hypothetical protein
MGKMRSRKIFRSPLRGEEEEKKGKKGRREEGFR